MAVSIQQAAANAFAVYLAAKMPDVDVTARWPSPDKALPAKAISVVTAGARRDTPIESKLLSATNSGSFNTNAVWQIAACTQPFQLDIWAHTDFDRDAILADLDIYLNYGERGLGTGNYGIGNGVLLSLSDGWDSYSSTADFAFEDPMTQETSDSALRRTYRATYHGNAHFMLAIPSTSPRQLLINFPMFLDGDSVATTYSTDL